MPKLLIHKDGENPTLESPEMTLVFCQRQEHEVGQMISIRYQDTAGYIERTDGFDGVDKDHPLARDAMVDLGWCQIAAVAVKDVEIITGEVE
jgi:hypothetical protein